MDQRSGISRIRNLLVQVKTVTKRLQYKYEDQFVFFRSKEINELVYEIEGNSYIAYEDMNVWDDDSEFMRRTYLLKTPTGRNEIQERIKMVAKFYTQYNMLTYEMPFMFITKTQDLFLRRQKRLKQLKKQQAMNGQDDQDSSKEEQSINSLQEQSQHNKKNFLKQLKLSLSQLMVEDDSSYLNIDDNPMDDTVYDIYQPEDQEFIPLDQHQINQDPVQRYTKKQLFAESNLDHLICDFAEIDIEQAIQFYREIIKTKNGSTVISQLIQEEIKSSQQNSQKHYQKNRSNPHILQLPDYEVQKDRNKLNSKIVNIPIKLPQSKNNKRLFTNSYFQVPKPKPKNKKQQGQLDDFIISKYLDQYRKMGLREVQNVEQEDELIQRQKKNRNKIRQKAEKLLLKIKTQPSTIQF